MQQSSVPCLLPPVGSRAPLAPSPSIHQPCRQISAQLTQHNHPPHITAVASPWAAGPPHAPRSGASPGSMPPETAVRAAGGCTAFPTLGLSFAPIVGDAVIWKNLDKDGHPDESTLHAGACRALPCPAVPCPAVPCRLLRLPCQRRRCAMTDASDSGTTRISRTTSSATDIPCGARVRPAIFARVFHRRGAGARR